MILKNQIIFSISIFSILLFSNSILNAQIQSKDSILLQIKILRNKGGESIQSRAYVDFLNELALKYRFRNADSIKLLSGEAFLISSKINYPIGKAFALLRRGDYYSDSGLEEKAFAEYKKSKNLAFSLNYPTLKVEVLKSLATQEFLSQNLNNAVLTFYEAIDLASKNNLYELEARLRHNLGYCYSNYKLYDEAHIEYLVADSLWVRVGGDNHFKAMTISNIALNAINKGDLELGYTYNYRSIDLLQKSNEVLWLSRAFRVRARYYIKKKQYGTAQKWIRKSDSLLSKLYNPRDQMEIDNIHSNILINLGDLNSAKEYSLQALKKALDFKDSLFQIQSYENLEKIEELLGRTDSAYSYYKKNAKIKSLLNENNEVQNIVLLRAKMNFVKEKEALRLENLKNTLTQQKYIEWITGALLTAIIIVLLMFKSSKKEKRLNKKLEEKSNTLAASEIDLKRINSNQKTLFSIVGHDLKGPISSLRELLKVMSSEEDKEALIKSLLPKLNNYTNHVHFTLDNLLNWGKTQMKGENMTPTTLNIYSIASDVLSLYSEAILKKELTIKLEIDKKIRAWADKEDINVVFRNLLSNAIKFTNSNGLIKLSGKSNDNHIIVEVEDNGVGMSAERKKLICDSSIHYSTFGTNNEKGTGLGLMLCKEIIVRNKGDISVESSENNGTIFTVLLLKSKTL